MKPSGRKPAGVLLILAGLALYAAGVALLAPAIGALPRLAQLPVYAFLGVLWILPLGPLLRWMETGRWRR